MGPFGFLLGLLGLLLEPLGRVRGASWSDLGASWRGLGASWDGLGTCVAASYFLEKIKMDFKSILSSKRHPKGTKMEPKSDQNASKNRSSEKVAKMMEKGSLLVHFAGPFWEPFSITNR